jgi:hypothetical protein
LLHLACFSTLGAATSTGMRVDSLLVARGLFSNRAAAKAAVQQGLVTTKSGKTIKKASVLIAPDAFLQVIDGSLESGLPRSTAAADAADSRAILAAAAAGTAGGAAAGAAAADADVGADVGADAADTDAAADGELPRSGGAVLRENQQLTAAGKAALLDTQTAVTPKRRQSAAQRAAARRNVRSAAASHAAELLQGNMYNEGGLQGRGKGHTADRGAVKHKRYSKKNKRGTAF